MAFLLKVSNSLEVLANELCAEMQQDSFSVFQPIYIVTQTEGINNWLNLQIAEQLGIAANIIFLKPNDLIFTAYKAAGGIKMYSLSSETLSWLIFHELGQSEFKNKFTDIGNYFSHGNEDDGVKKMALAQKLADLFDQYQVYRADMIQQWNAADKPAGEWQEYLWRSIQKKLDNDLPDKTEMANLIRNAMQQESNAARLKNKMPVVYFFGISIITSFHLEILHQLAREIDIKFLLLNPAPGDYWFEEMDEKRLTFLKKIGRLDAGAQSEGNALLLSWGKLIQNTFYLLFQEESILNSYEELSLVKQLGDSLLQKIQLQITNNIKEPAEEFTLNDLQDESVVINSCFSPMREVQAFYNYLIHLFHVKKENILPRNVIVMVSDINLYAPYIKAVFDTSATKFKYHIADASVAAGDGMISALQALLQFRESNFTAEQVIRFLDFQCIREHFSIKDTTALREIVEAANIRFGIKNNHEDDSYFVSWTQGLQRIMYGITMSGESLYGKEPEDFFPIDLIEGSRAYESISFVHFVQLLMDAVESRKKLRTIPQWISYIEGLLTKFIAPPDSADEEYLYLIKRLAGFNLAGESFDEQVSYEVFLQNFETGIMDEARTQDFIRGGITFCSLIPMRSVPFTVVAMLGMNYDKFPRKEKPVSFNLMAKEKRKGDRNIRENDKHLFLETLLSAKDFFYISFVGQSITSNAHVPASALVDELINYIRQHTQPGIDSTCPLYQQPLHTFSNIYKEGKQGVYSYIGESEKKLHNIFKDDIIPYEHPKELSLDKLIRFLREPVKGYYNDVLNIYFEDVPQPLPETELFETDQLVRWTLKNKLLVQDAEELVDWEKEQKKKGFLPLKNAGSLVLENMREEIEIVKAIYVEYTAGKKEEHLNIDITINGVQLKGTVDNVYGNNILSVSLSKNELKYLIQAYISWLALGSAGYDHQLIFISAENESAFEAASISKIEAKKKLGEVIRLYERGHEEMLCFSSQLKLDLGKLNDEGSKHFSKVVDDLLNKDFHPCNDKYLNKENANGFFDNGEENFTNFSETLLLPLLEFLPEYFS